jgi:hypothetical protein
MDPATELIDTSEDLFLIANLLPKHTGLPFVVCISYRGNTQHDVRVKVSPSSKAMPSEMTAVAIRPEVRVAEDILSGGDLALLKQWISLNHGVILSYWNGEIDTADAIGSLKSL